MATLSRHSHFLAHSSNVNCLRFGRKSGQVAATGGDDNMVNLWRMREKETKNIMSLSGHQSAVESVVFDPAEKKVVAGSKAGSIKAFDLEAAKVSRTLKGHMSTCTALDYHLYGDYVASGSLDTVVKVWDLRTKGCMQTFKGHGTDVTSLCFTPDGRWLTSGGADGTIKIWDLTAGKMLRDFSDHGGAITGLEFNPEEFIMVSSSTDRTIRIWDVQEFSLIGVSPVDNATTTTMCHTLAEPYTGKYLMCCSQEAIRVWSYETAIECHDSVVSSRSKDLGIAETPVDSTMLQDMKLMGGSIQDAFVSIWVLDLMQVRPFGSPANAPSTGGSGVSSSVPGRNSGRPDSARGAPPRNVVTPSRTNAPPPLRNDPSAPAGILPNKPEDDARRSLDRLRLESADRAAAASRPETPGMGNVPNSMYRPPTQQGAPMDRPSSQPRTSGAVSRPQTQNTPRQDDPLSAPQDRSSRPPSARPPSSHDRFDPQSENAVDETPVANAKPRPEAPEAERIVTSDYIMELRCGMDTCVKTFTARQKCAQQLLGYWEKGNLHDSFRYLSQLPSGKREALVVDLLRATDLQALGVDLETCVLLLPLVSELLNSKLELYLDAGLESAQKLFNAFSPIVKDARDARPLRAREVNLAGEERWQRCSSCDAYFQELDRQVRQLEAAGGAGFPLVDRKLHAFARALGEFYQ